MGRMDEEKINHNPGKDYTQSRAITGQLLQENITLSITTEMQDNTEIRVWQACRCRSETEQQKGTVHKCIKNPANNVKKQKQKEIEIETENNSILRKLRSQTIKKKRKKHWMGPKMKQNLL